MSKVALGALAMAVLGAGTLAAQDGARSGPTAPELQQGKQVYAQWCAPCHAAKPNLAGTSSLAIKYQGTDTPAPLEDRTDLQPAVISYFVRNGVAWMPPFRPTEISDAQLAALNAYLTAPLAERGPHAPLLAEEMHAHRLEAHHGGEGQ